MDLFLNDIKSHFNLDLFDKIIICLTFIIGALFFPFYCFASEVENVEVSSIGYLTFTKNNPIIIESASSSGIGYFEIEPGYKYTFVNNSPSATKFLGFSNSIPEVGVTVYNVVNIEPGGTYEFSSSYVSYAYFDYYSYSTLTSLTKTKLEGMEGFIDNLTFYNNTENFWSVFNSIIPYILVVVIVCIGLLIIRRLLSSLSKGKSRI